MQTVASFLDAVGRDKFTEAIGATPQLVSRAKVDNIMPPGWFISVRDFCAAEGIETPEHLFRWSDKRKRVAAE